MYHYFPSVSSKYILCICLLQLGKLGISVGKYTASQASWPHHESCPPPWMVVFLANLVWEQQWILSSQWGLHYCDQTYQPLHSFLICWCQILVGRRRKKGCRQEPKLCRKNKISKMLREHTGFNNAVNKVLTRNQTIIIFVHFSEQISQTWLLVVHELQELRKKNVNFIKWTSSWIIKINGTTMIRLMMMIELGHIPASSSHPSWSSSHAPSPGGSCTSLAGVSDVPMKASRRCAICPTAVSRAGYGTAAQPLCCWHRKIN